MNTILKEWKRKEVLKSLISFFFKYAYQYDNHNRIIEKTTYENGSEVNQKILYEYDYAGNKIKETSYTLNDAEELSVSDRRLFKYDKENKLVAETHIMDGTEYQTTYEYNESGKLSKEVSSEREILYSYDNNFKITKTCIRENKKLWWKEEEFYDSNGNKIQSIHYDDSNRINNQYFYKYNEKNLTVLDSCVDLDGTLSFMNKSYYKNDTLRLKKSISSHWLLSSEQGFPGWVETGDGKFEYTTYQTLDKFGNVIKELIDYVLLQELVFEYKEFDSKGNWTKRVVREFGKPYRIEKREIEYY
jgi:YD repeat-containing protein